MSIVFFGQMAAILPRGNFMAHAQKYVLKPNKSSILSERGNGSHLILDHSKLGRVKIWRRYHLAIMSNAFLVEWWPLSVQLCQNLVLCCKKWTREPLRSKILV
jgi:hypothetical protein